MPGEKAAPQNPPSRNLRPNEDAAEQTRPRHIAGSKAAYSLVDVRDGQNLIDWFPNEHLAIQNFRSGKRRSSDPRKPNTNTMIELAKSLSDEELKAAAEYFGAQKWWPWIRVVETDLVPKRGLRAICFCRSSKKKQSRSAAASSKCRRMKSRPLGVFRHFIQSDGVIPFGSAAHHLQIDCASRRHLSIRAYPPARRSILLHRQQRDCWSRYIHPSLR